MIPFLGPTDPFPPVERALDAPNGLLAAGADLSVPRLIDAYAHGIFPWYSHGDPILWWSPDPRTVLVPRQFHVSRSLGRRLKTPGLRVTADTAFRRVLDECAAPRKGESGTWLVPAMRRAYEALHEEGVARLGRGLAGRALVGGVYGVALGRMFFGESMFSRAPDGSKMALARLSAQLDRWGFPLIDCQLETEHLLSLGATRLSRRAFVREVARLAREPATPRRWQLDEDLVI